MDVETLSLDVDRARVADLFARAADYVRLESGSDPTEATVRDFFEERPPNLGPEQAGQVGFVVKSRLVGIAAYCIGYPEPSDSYIGLMIFDPEGRGQGIGTTALAAVTKLARDAGARRQFVAVLEANTAGRAFWEKQGFVLETVFPPSSDAHTRLRMVRAV